MQTEVVFGSLHAYRVNALMHAHNQPVFFIPCLHTEAFGGPCMHTDPVFGGPMISKEQGFWLPFTHAELGFGFHACIHRRFCYSCIHFLSLYPLQLSPFEERIHCKKKPSERKLYETRA